MRVGRWVGAGLLVACDNKDAGTSGTTPYDFECEVSEPDDLADPFARIEGHEHDCEDGVYYNPGMPTATTYYVGEFHKDDCGTVFGKETWILYPNDTWRNLGGKQCQVVWTVSGTEGERVNVGSYSLSLSMVVDPEETDCDEIPDFEDYYEQTFGVVYDVGAAGRDSTVYFESGNVLGTGEINANHVTYTSDVNCKLF